MKKLAIILLITIVQFSFSQSKKVITGSVFSQEFLISGVEVINKSLEQSTTTNANGKFSITARANDSIFFYHKNYELKGIKISSDDIQKGIISIEITKKAEELKEVVIQSFSLGAIMPDQNTTNEIELEKKKKSLQRYISGYNDGTIPNGMDFVKIGKMIFGGLFKGKKEIAVNTKEFKDVATANFDQKFYTENLKLKKEEMDAFLSFCNFDPESKKMLSKNSNDLELMDFLYKKSVEFRKINASE